MKKEERDLVLWIAREERDVPALRNALTRMKCDVDHVERTSALTKLGERDYHLILLTLDGPIDGAFELIRAIREHETYGAIPVIVLTDRMTSPDLLARAFVEGAHDHIDDMLSERSIEARLATAKQWRTMVMRLRERAARISATVDESKRAKHIDVDARKVQRDSLPTVPRAYGPLRISGDVLASNEVRGDLFDVVTDDAGRVTVFALSGGGKGPAAIALTSGAQDVARRALAAGESLENVSAKIQRYVVSQEQPNVVSMALLRFSPDASSAEIVNAGYPPILATRGSPRVVSFISRSKPFGLLDDERHPIELVSVPPGAAFLLASDGLASPGGSQDGLVNALGFVDGALALASSPGAELRALMEQITGERSESSRDDAMLVFVAIDPVFAPSFPSPPPSKRGFDRE